MGGGGLASDGTGMHPCTGDDVMRELNDVFGTPGSERYKYAMDHNSFDQVKNEPGNYRTLILAYVDAGVDVQARWGVYLRLLGANADGRSDIHEIAKTRYKALTNKDPHGQPAPLAMQTDKHILDDIMQGGKRVKTEDGSPGHPSKINSPFPLPEPATK